MMTLSEDNHGGVQLDPMLFNAFDIKQVPAVLVTKDIQCVTTKTCSGTYHVVYGDIHLEYALEKIANQKDELSPIAQSALKTLRGYNHA
jgi:type-F conjugative transfer system pilin assembly protein TrbC